MIKRETLKQAIDAISRRDPEIGYALDEMLAVGKIDVPAPGQDPMLGDDFYFLFDGYKARVSRFLYINKGNIPIEERLLLKYGELQKKRELIERGDPIDTPETAWVIRAAGLRFMVVHELDYAIERVKSQGKELGTIFDAPAQQIPPAEGSSAIIFSSADPGERYRRLISFLETVKQEPGEGPLACDSRDDSILYRGVLGEGVPAVFMRFPYAMNSLLQVADINIEFFHVRFFLNRLIYNQWQHLYACVAKNKIVGLLYLTFKRQLFHKNLEIKFIASARSAPAEGVDRSAPPFKGVGTFLVAGAWLQWRTRLSEAREILLDSEIGARRFYDSLGFVSRGFAEYILGKPRAYLLRAIVSLANSSAEVGPQVYSEIGKILQKQIRSLRRRVKTDRELAERKVLIEAAGEFLKMEKETRSSQKLLRLLQKYHNKAPESAAPLKGYPADQNEKWKERTEREAGSRY